MGNGSDGRPGGERVQRKEPAGEARAHEPLQPVGIVRNDENEGGSSRNDEDEDGIGSLGFDEKNEHGQQHRFQQQQQQQDDVAQEQEEQPQQEKERRTANGSSSSGGAATTPTSNNNANGKEDVDVREKVSEEQPNRTNRCDSIQREQHKQQQ